MTNLSKKQLKELREKNPDINIPDDDLKIDSFNKLLNKSIVEDSEKLLIKTLKEIKKHFKLSDSDIADIFDYKNVNSYRNSKAKDKIDTAIERLYLIFSKKT